ncbi:MAG: class IV adenylate cyclase [Tissierellia bacterium]|nr:class IV adenylate cyclase [Tissierellia bacterium]
MEKEFEVKVLGMDLDALEKKLIKLGGKLIAEEEQTNILIDSSQRPIKSYLDAYLRIRKTKDLLTKEEKTVITLKKNLGKDGIRGNMEISTEVKDEKVLLEILKDLGFDRVEVGYKRRKSYEFMDARLDFDQWDENTYPYPYMEIEVRDIKHLNKITSSLEIPQENISTKSIVQLRKELKLV